MAVDMIYYASLGKKGKVLHCLKNGVHVDAMNHNKETALFFAAKNGKSSTVKALLKHDADPNRMTVYDMTPVIVAAANNHESCLRLLLKYGGTWNTQKNKVKNYMVDGAFEISDEEVDNNKRIGEVPFSDVYVDYNPEVFKVKNLYCFKNCQISNVRMTAKLVVETENKQLRKDLIYPEFLILRSLRHPNIIQAFHTSFYPLTNQDIILTEPIINQNLYHVINSLKQKIEMKTKFRILLEIASACLFLQKQGILHNFLNSSSVYLTGKWSVKVGNMEFANSVNDQAKELPQKFFDFHLPNMAPEVVGSNEKTSFSDVYSFGCLTWEIFGGRRAWKWLSNDDLVSLSYVNHHICLPLQSCWPTSVKKIISSCTVHKKESRPQFQTVFQLLGKSCCDGKTLGESASGNNMTQSVSSNLQQCPLVIINKSQSFCCSCQNTVMKNQPKVTFSDLHINCEAVPRLENCSTTLKSNGNAMMMASLNLTEDVNSPLEYGLPISRKSCLKARRSSEKNPSDLLHLPSCIEDGNDSKATQNGKQLHRQLSDAQMKDPEAVIGETQPVAQTPQDISKKSYKHWSLFWDREAEPLKDLETILNLLRKKGKTEQEIVFVIKNYFKFIEEVPHEYTSANTCEHKNQSLLQQIFEEAGLHQKKEWAKASTLSKDESGCRQHLSKCPSDFRNT